MEHHQSLLGLKLTSIGNHDLGFGLSGLGALALHLANNIQTLDDSSENYVLAIQPWCSLSADKELRTVRVRPSVGHGQDTGFGVFLFKLSVRVKMEDEMSATNLGEVFVSELLTVDGLSTSSVMAKITIISAIWPWEAT